MLKAVSLDFWDTLYAGADEAERASLRREAIGRLLTDVGRPVDDAELSELFTASRQEAERWWREEQRGYVAADRIRWILARAGVERPDDCPHVARAVRAVDDALHAHPPALLPGAAEAVRALAAHFRLVVISDTGFASGRAQDELMDRDGLGRYFVGRVYSCDVGHAKPHPEPFRRALRALSLQPDELLHVGDFERSDVRGALGVGSRAIRLDVVRASGPSAAELVAESWSEVVDALLREA